jgi:hypothetical protein
MPGGMRAASNWLGECADAPKRAKFAEMAAFSAIAL